MKKARNREELLASLAAQGDPAAFFALFADRLEQRLNENVRVEGGIEQAQSALEDFAAELYRKFVLKKPLSDPFAWYDKEYGQPSAVSASEETDLEAVQNEHASGVGRSKLIRRLQREYTTIKCSRRRRERRSIGKMRQPATTGALFSVALFFVLLIGGYVMLLVTDSRLIVEQNGHAALRLPWGGDSAATVGNASAVARAIADSVVTDSAGVDSGGMQAEAQTGAEPEPAKSRERRVSKTRPAAPARARTPREAPAASPTPKTETAAAIPTPPSAPPRRVQAEEQQEAPVTSRQGSAAIQTTPAPPTPSAAPSPASSAAGAAVTENESAPAPATPDPRAADSTTME